MLLKLVNNHKTGGDDPASSTHDKSNRVAPSLQGAEATSALENPTQKPISIPPLPLTSLEREKLLAFSSVLPETLPTARLKDVFQMPLLDKTLERIVQSARFKDRLNIIVEDYFKPGPINLDVVSSDDLRIAFAALSQFERLCDVAGAVWNGEILRKTVHKAGMSEAVAHLGRETVAFAMQNAPPLPQSLPDTASTPVLEKIRSDGAKCFMAWAENAPACIVQRLQLRKSELFNSAVGFSEVFRQHGALVLRQAARYEMTRHAAS